MHPIIQHLKSIMDPYLNLLNNSDKDLIKLALSRTYGDVVQGTLNEYEFLRDTECSGRHNQGKVIQLITDYIIWSYGSPKLTVTEHAFIYNHPLQEFIRLHRELINIVPEVITHYIEKQGWYLSRNGVDDSIAMYIPEVTRREVNIE